jgi:hypothetical protein
MKYKHIPKSNKKKNSSLIHIDWLVVALHTRGTCILGREEGFVVGADENGEEKNGICGERLVTKGRADVRGR